MGRNPIGRPLPGEGTALTPEQEPAPYYRAARFQSERPAARAYQQARELVYHADLALSCFRFFIQRTSHVTVLGDPPPADIDRRIEQILRLRRTRDAVRGDPGLPQRAPTGGGTTWTMG